MRPIGQPAQAYSRALRRHWDDDEAEAAVHAGLQEAVRLPSYAELLALAPATVQRMPARSSRAPIRLQPASTTPDEMHRFQIHAAPSPLTT